MKHIYLLSTILLLGCVKTDYEAPKVPQPVSVVYLAQPWEAVTTLNENFDAVALVDGQIPVMPKGWANLANENARAWQTGVIAPPDGADSTYKHVQCLAGSGYLAMKEGAIAQDGDIIVDAWLVLPPIQVTATTGSTLDFLLARAYEYSGHTSTLEIYWYACAKNDNAPVANPTVFSKCPTAASPGSDWRVFQPHSIDLTTVPNFNIADKNIVYVAFRYQADKNGSSWYVDDIKFNVQ